MSCAGIPTNPHSPFSGPAGIPMHHMVPRWTLALLSVGLVSRESVINLALERQAELLNILQVASSFKAVEALAGGHHATP